MSLSRAPLIALLAGAILLGGLPSAGALPAGAAAPAPPTVLRTLAALPSQTPARSRAVEAPVPFSMVGVRTRPGVHPRVRTSADGRRWSAWTELEPLPADEGPDPDTTEHRAPAGGLVPTAPFWTGRARWLQLDAPGGRAADLRVVVIDTLGQSRSLPGRAWDAVRAASRPVPAQAAATQPRIVTRAEWGADESMRKGDPSYSRRVRAAFVHHTVNANTYTQAEAPALIRGVYRYHTQSNGWDDVGYNFLVDRFGTVYEGRAGGVDRPVLGAHAGGFNSSTFGVASLGTHDAAGPVPAAVESIARLIAWKFDIHHVDVTGAARLRSRGSTRFAEGTVVDLPTISGHRAVSVTSCPGNALESLLPAIRRRVLELGGSMILDHDAAPNEVTVARGRPVGGPVRFSGRLRPAGEWTLELRDPDGLAIHSASGSGETVTSEWQPLVGASLGRYHWTLSSPGRTPASEWLDLVLPVIGAPAVSLPIARGGRDSGFVQPLRFTAALWPEAAWSLTVTAPDGLVAHRAQGVGAALDASWPGRAGLLPGRYRWQMEADDAAPVAGELEVLWPVLARAGAATDAPGRSVTLSRAAFAQAGSAEHAVLARADVFADAMAGGPLAGTTGPVLLTGRDRLDARVRTELERVLPAGATVYLLGGDGALGPAVASALAGRWRVARLSGTGREETAAAIADVVLRRSGADRVLVARGGPDAASPWADALAGGAYGAANGVPVLLTHPDRLSPAVAALIARRGVTRAIVLGGPGAVGDAVLDALPSPSRVFGLDRAGTAVAVARQLWGRSDGALGDKVVIGNGFAADAWTLALSASPLAARNDAPLLLSNRDTLPPATAGYLDALGYAAPRTAEGWILGAEDSVAQAAADEAARRLQ